MKSRCIQSLGSADASRSLPPPTYGVEIPRSELGVWKSVAKEGLKLPWNGGWETETPRVQQRGKDEVRGEKGKRGMSERERLPPFYSGADLHNDQRLSCLSKLFSAICIIFSRAMRERESDKVQNGEGEETQSALQREHPGTLTTLNCVLSAWLIKL